MKKFLLAVSLVIGFQSVAHATLYWSCLCTEGREGTGGARTSAQTQKEAAQQCYNLGVYVVENSCEVLDFPTSPVKVCSKEGQSVWANDCCPGLERIRISEDGYACIKK